MGQVMTGEGVARDWKRELRRRGVGARRARSLAARGLTIRAQRPDRGALLDGAGNIYRTVRPDLVVYRGALPVSVIDAKYKEYWRGQPLRKVSNDDLYQLFFYAERLQMQHGLKSPPRAVIVCPLPASDERQGVAPIQPHLQHIEWRAGNASSSVHLVLLPLTRILRQISRDGLSQRQTMLTRS